MGNRAERWTPKQIHRLITPEKRAEAQWRATQRRELEARPPAPIVSRGIVTTSRLVECRHGVTWTCCTICSKPRPR